MKLLVANLTPFLADGRPDLLATERHTRWMASQGVDGFAPTGTTGGFLYLSPTEKRAVHEAVLAGAGGRPVVPCVWDPDPMQMRALAQGAAEAGAWRVFLPPPLYHPVSDDTVVRWYAQVADACSVPVMAYHHPRVHNPISVPLMARLIDEAGVVAMKDSSGDAGRVRALSEAFPGRIWAGGDHLLGMGTALGPAEGHISRLGNLRPALCAGLARGATGTALAQKQAQVRAELAALKASGGIPAMLHLLGFQGRFPLDAYDPRSLGDLPPTGLPAESA